MRNIVLLIMLSAIIGISGSCSSSEKEEKPEYQCPMKCEGSKTYDKEGQCPVCEMDLEEVK